jgi:5-formyltetrahydrofolate cyclo-ligase
VAPPFCVIARTERDQLRRQMRERRRNLPRAVRAAASIEFARIAERALLLQPGRRIAVYLAANHEANLEALIDVARARRCRLYLPTIIDYRRSRMVFKEYAARGPLRVNRYGIAEPGSGAARIALLELDLILVPLVAVDSQGARLGSGAGFYDRCLHHLRGHRRWRRPKLIGVAYELQRVPHLAPAPWDVPLDALITERNFYRTPQA